MERIALSGVEGPTKLYKYMSMEGDKLGRVRDVLCNHHVYCSAAKWFNDPFDLRPVFDLQAPNKAMRKGLERTAKRLEPHLSRAERRAKSRQMLKESLGARCLADTQASFEEGMATFLTEKVGVLCLTTKSDDILMWSHYADAHRGVCLEFEVGENFAGEAQKVRYSNDRVPIVPYVDDTANAMSKALLTKSSHWSYEDEWRYLRVKHGPGRQAFDPHALTSVIIGAVASAETIQYIEQWIAQRRMHLEIRRAFLSRKAFAIDVI